MSMSKDRVQEWSLKKHRVNGDQYLQYEWNI